MLVLPHNMLTTPLLIVVYQKIQFFSMLLHQNALDKIPSLSKNVTSAFSRGKVRRKACFAQCQNIYTQI